MAEPIATLLRRSAAPLTWRQLENQARMRGEDLEGAVSAAIREGTAYRWPDHRRSKRFWHRNPDELVREQILATAAECAVTSPELAKLVAKRIPAYPRKLLTAAITQLAREKALRKYAWFGRSGVLLGRDGVPQAYAAAARVAIAKIEAMVAALGGPAPAVTGPPTSLSGQALLDAINKLEPNQGAPVSVRELRALISASKHEFDQTALALRNSEQVFLSRHDYPQSLTQADRDLLVDGGDGSYYVAITAR